MYANPTLTDHNIPHKSTMAAAIDAKVEKLDLIDLNTLRVSPFIVMIYLFVLTISIAREFIGKYQLLGMAGQQSIGSHTPLPYILSTLYLISPTTSSSRVACLHLNQPLEDTPEMQLAMI